MVEGISESFESSAFFGIGVVAIGRNEGDRLRRCLESISAYHVPIVYVDSGSTDGSVDFATSIGADVVILDRDTPFTAARARNAGYARLIELHDTVEFVQFVDGDCEIEDGWLQDALQFLRSRENVAIACGRRSERFPESSVYNLLCDMEWDTDIGETESTGGDCLVRVKAFDAVQGFNDNLIAGEEPEMCYRMRLAGWKIYRLDSPMTLHDAAMKTIGQWARRSSRAGYAYVARAFLHWRDLKGYCMRETARILFWGLAFPVVVLVLMLALSPWFAVLLLIYVVQVWRIYRQKRSRYAASAAGAYAFYTVLGKWTELYGLALFVVRVIRRQEQRLIEYK